MNNYVRLGLRCGVKKVIQCEMEEEAPQRQKQSQQPISFCFQALRSLNPSINANCSKLRCFPNDFLQSSGWEIIDVAFRSEDCKIEPLYT
jgi:hypothetical protein